MLYFREGSKETIISLDTPPISLSEHQPMLFPSRNVADWFNSKGMAEKNIILWANENFIKPHLNFVDIGAHVGTYSWMLGKNSLHTYSFECSPTTFCYLAANIALHNLCNKVTPYCCALGDKEGTLDYIVRSEDGGGNGVKVLTETDKTLPSFAIPVKTLDSFNIHNIGFIKIDVEGFEKEVLQGATETLKRSNYPPILFESWGDWKNGPGFNATALQKDLFDYIESIGYKITKVSGIRDTYIADHHKII